MCAVEGLRSTPIILLFSLLTGLFRRAEKSLFKAFLGNLFTMTASDQNTSAPERPGILHITWWEGALSSGILENQVYEPLRCMADAHPEYRWMLFSAGPFLKTGFRDWLLRSSLCARFVPHAHIRNRLDTEVLRRDLGKHGIALFLRETVYAPRTIYLRWPVPLMFPWFHLARLARVIRRGNVKVVHCRSYSAAWVAMLTRRWMRVPFRLVFDMRGLVPEEGVLHGIFSRDSKSYRFWKRIEQALLEAADLIIAPSDTFAEHVETLTSNRNIFTPYTHSPIDVFSETPANTDWYEKFPALRNRPSLAYIGALGPTSFHSLENLVLMYSAFRRVITNALLLIISRSDPQWLRAQLTQAGLGEEDYVLAATAGAREMAGLLKLARYGALPYRVVTSPEEELIGRTMMASKTGEYLAAGLPLICHPGIGSAARLIREQGVGCVYDIASSPDALRDSLTALDHDYHAVRKRCLDAAHIFDVQLNTERCVQRYKELMCNI